MKQSITEAEVTKQLSPEIQRKAAHRARDRANAARWNLNIAILLFAVVILVFILSLQGIAIEIVGPVAIFGLAMVWLVGWRQAKRLYQRFYDEELSRGEIVVMCAWCGNEVYRDLSLGKSVVSHGICPECKEKYFPKSLFNTPTSPP